jgi:membrane-associated phospholipid phosphatase
MAAVPRTSGAHGLDKTLFLDVNHFAVVTGWLHGPMLAYATYGIALFAVLLAAGFWTARQRGAAAVAAALWAVAGTVVAVGITQLVGHAVAEARPWQSLPHALILAGHQHDFSFPSDHAVMAGAVTAGLFIVSRRLGTISAVAAVLLCFARVYIGAHYPQDVVAGLLLGTAVVAVGYLLVRVPLRVLAEWMARTPLRPIVSSAPAGALLAPGTGPAPARDAARGAGAQAGTRGTPR